MGILKKIGEATIVKESLRLAKLATAHPYFTYFLYNGLVVGLMAYACYAGYQHGHLEGEIDEAHKSAKCASKYWNDGYEIGYESGKQHGRILEKLGISEK